jgi:hypothetical protein
MSVARSVADVLRDHVVLELEAIDRMYLNVYVPHLQTVGAVVGYLRGPKLMQRLSDGLSADRIDRLLRKWLKRLPHPFPPRDRAAGYRYQLSILQAEFALTQVLDQPVTGRIFFEEVIRENLDLGRPSQVSLVFDRKVTRRTPGRFRTRVITDGVVPSLHVDYKKARIKQYHKEGQALRRPPSTIPVTSTSAGASKISRTSARSALPPTDVCSTSSASAMTALSVKHRSMSCKELSPSTVNARQPCGSPIHEFRAYCMFCFSLCSSRERSLTAISVSILLRCSDKSRANSLLDGLPTTCDACVCTASSSAFQKPIGIE